MLAFLLGVAISAVGRPSDADSAIFYNGKCETLVQTGSVHRGIAPEECGGLAVIDRRLNAAYRRRMASLDKEAKMALKTSQRQWIANRNATCGLAEPVSIADEETASCFMNETNKRLSFLENHGTRGKQSARPIAPGLYCLKEPMAGYTGVKGHDIPLGDFIMSVEISRKDGRYAISIANQMPDNSQILDAETSEASVMRDGSLAFSFTDGWENEGRARVYPNGKVLLVMTKKAETLMNQIGRNYGTFAVSKSECSADEFQRHD